MCALSPPSVKRVVYAMIEAIIANLTGERGIDEELKACDALKAIVAIALPK